MTAMQYTMKDSGVPWIGDVPEHWGNRRIKELATKSGTLFTDGDWINSPDISENGIRYLTTGNVGQGFFKEQGNGYITEDTFNRLECTMVHKGDLIISRLNEPIGRACIVPDVYDDCIVAVDNVILRPDSDYDKKFLMYCMSSDRYAEYTALLARGTTMHRISRTLLGNILLPIPPLPEQEAIAAYLNEKCGTIDGIIAEAKATIEEYKAWKASVIFEAVTKGVDPHAGMKDSGYLDIGMIPSQWETSKIKRHYSVICGATPSDDTNNWDGPISWIGPADMQDFGRIASGKRSITKQGYDSCGTTLVPVGSVILSTRAPIGKIQITMGDLCTNQGCKALVRRNNNSYPEYLSYYLFAIKERLQVAGTGTTFKELSTSSLANMPLLVPDLDEQQKIVEHLDRQCSAIDGIIAEKQSLIDDLETYKKSLIFETVTGKRRVC